MATHIQIGDISPRIQYTADGAQAAFTYPFPIFKDGDVEVYLDNVKQASGYTVTGAGQSAGGSVTFDVAPDNGVIVTLRRYIVLERTSDFQEQGKFRSKVLNDELDYQVAAMQHLEEELGRAVKRSVTDDSTADLTLPVPEAEKALIWNPAADGLENGPAVTDIANAAANAANALASASAASSSATAASSSASAAAVSASAAAASAASNLFSKIGVKAAGDSPYSVAADTDDGTLFQVDSSGGNVTLNLPSIATALEGERYGFLRTSASNTVTLVRAGTDTINGVDGDFTMSALAGDILLVVADEDTPNNWVVIPWTQAQAGAGLSKSGNAIALDLASDNAWTGSQRGTFVVVTDGTIDMDAGNNFQYTPTGADVLEFSNETNGQSGVLHIVNPSGHAITLGAEVDADAGFVSAVSTAGTYPCSYYSPDGTAVVVTRGVVLA